ncbi:MAG: hypothetical protein K9N07_10165 [Candidatus Cloacimonetes bacterium]|nr:hypothetical protein [Candidatus Cloacimonadota bacterium]
MKYFLYDKTQNKYLCKSQKEFALFPNGNLKIIALKLNDDNFFSLDILFISEVSKDIQEKINGLLYKLHNWSESGLNPFLLLRKFIIDSIDIINDENFQPRFIFSKSLILFLQSHKHFDPVFAEQLKYLIEYHFGFIESNIKTLKNDNILFAAEQYLEMCMDDNNQDWFDLHSKELNREVEVERIAKLLIEIRNDVKEEEESRKLGLLLRKARTWLMLRYDIDKAAYYQFYRHPFWLKVFKFLPEVCGLIIFFSLAFINHPFWEFIESPVMKVLNNFSIYNLAVLALYAVFLMEGYVLIRKIKSGKNQTQVFMPRVAGGIIVGYFAVLVEEVWLGLYRSSVNISNPDSINWFIFAGRIIIPLLAIYVYLLIEMSNVKGIGNIRLKALRILSRGYSYSLMLGVLFCDIFGDNLFRIVSESVNQADPAIRFSAINGLFGNIYPEPVLLLSPLALFIGIFLQLLWEDKAVTEKI